MSSEPRRSRGALSRRDFLKVSGGCVAGVPVLVAGSAATAPSAGAQAAGEANAYPAMDIARLSQLKPGDSVAFNYPDESSPALLLRLQQAAEGGVGDDSTVVAFSMLCTHKGCPVSFKAEQQLLICPCHWSTFDPAKEGTLVIGQASTSLPRIELAVAGDMVRAVGVDGLIYGRHTNVL